ncbi:AP-1 complex-associated regulatory protein isoform X2 [Anguilla rostrata]|uniref:AP-1 complex-associated regulatory protein isoform X2 n=1 Tax=Anguilla anguilla TaxID=7936 RepID=UPI0015AB6CD8|nr:AP-1 complex-associated regulatory protein isoform X2 [Anguilla anguilla]
MGNCWSQCYGMFRREANRIQRGGGSKYFRSTTTGEHYTIEFENLVESDEGETPGSSPRPVSEEEINHLREQRYAAISAKQALIDQNLQAELEAREEALRREEEAEYAAQREAARAARERMHAEQAVEAKAEDGRGSGHQKTLAAGEDFETHASNAKTQAGGASRSSRVSSETNVATPNTESSYDVTSKTRSTNEDGTSLDLEWEDEEGMSVAVLVPERSRTEEDILKAAAGRRGTRGSCPASASEDSNALEWENDFVSAHGDDFECDGFVNPLADTPSEVTTETSISDKQDR